MVDSKRLHVPEGDGPWTWRRFGSQEEAERFRRLRLPGDNPPPFELEEPHAAPDGTELRRGTWVLLYRPILN